MAHRGQGLAVQARLARFRRGELGGLAGDSFYTGIWQGSISLAHLAQIALVTHTLGLSEYGRLALVISLVTLVGQFFDVRVAGMTVPFGAQYLREGARPAAGVFQFSYLIDASTGVVGFVVVAVLAPLFGESLVGPGGGELLLIYAFALLLSTLDNTSITVVRLLDRFRLLATYQATLELLRVGLLVGALALFDSVLAVVVALVIYQGIGGAMNALVAAAVFRHALPEGRLTRPALSAVRHERRAMLGMLAHTNVFSYSRLAQVQLPTVLLGALTSTTEVGLYKVGTAAAAIVRRVADPLQTALTPRLARLWTSGRHAHARRLVRQVAIIATVAMVALLVVLVVAREPILQLLGGGDTALEAVPVLILVAAGQAVSGAMFWSTSTLWATRRAGVLAWTGLGGAALQLALFPLVVPGLEATGAALAYLVSLTVSNLVAGWLALRTLRHAAPSRAVPDRDV